MRTMIWAVVTASLAVGALGCDGGCESEDDCDEDEYCTVDPGSDDSGECLERKGSGASCEADKECRENLSCIAGSCDRPPPSGYNWDFTPKCSASPAGAEDPALALPLALAAVALAARRRRAR